MANLTYVEIVALCLLIESHGEKPDNDIDSKACEKLWAKIYSPGEEIEFTKDDLNILWWAYRDSLWMVDSRDASHLDELNTRYKFY